MVNKMQTEQILLNIKNIFQTESYLSVLLDFERVLDNLHLYVYDNWEYGELVDGPRVEKHWVTCSFMWPYKMMPNPRGAKRLLDYKIKIKYKKDTLERPIKVNKPSDYAPGTRYPKLQTSEVWIVDITIPRPLMEDIYRGTIEIEGEHIDLSNIDNAYADDLDLEGIANELESTDEE